MENLIKPKLLDLYCCGGGAGRGYELAGFDVTGVDNVPQPKHRGKFILADAIEYVLQHGQEFDFIHASLRIAAIVGQVELGSTPNKLTILHN